MIFLKWLTEIDKYINLSCNKEKNRLIKQMFLNGDYKFGYAGAISVDDIYCSF